MRAQADAALHEAGQVHRVRLSAQREAEENLAPDGRAGDGDPAVVGQFAGQHAADHGERDAAGDQVDHRFVGRIFLGVGR
ncbi:hypothetical protein SDC9_199765 [bioreactor metagenome]|uniref:Uncharacterized protein n=1 Tax=bioreactor metagenome TaxID=1076179 RepID=A0A645ILE5_9ZZZZ